jgi:uncharacterized membrane protein
MSKFVVITFANEASAYQGTRALKALHDEGSLTLYGLGVIAKDAGGKLSIKDSDDGGPVATALGALLGGLVGVIGGPAGVAAGAVGGSYIGCLIDLVNLGVSEDFATKVGSELAPGKTAVVAEIGEDWTTPLDTRMEALGGKVLRTWRADFEDDQIAKDVAARNADLAQLRAEFAQASAENKAKLKAKVDQAKSDLEAAGRRLQARVDALGKEMNAKLEALDKQISTAQADAKQKMKARAAAIRADYEARTAKLKQAWALTKEALAA